jgi:NTP pyrophosphatase (non-canonical NTP hydrolase)
MALTGEVGELVENFQWLTETESLNLDDDAKERVSHEMADVLLYLVRMADVMRVDLLKASKEKLKINAIKYPVEKSKGNNRKYSEL